MGISISLGACSKCRFLGPTSDLLKRKLRGWSPPSHLSFPRPLPDSNACWCWKSTEKGSFNIKMFFWFHKLALDSAKFLELHQETHFHSYFRLNVSLSFELHLERWVGFSQVKMVLSIASTGWKNIFEILKDVFEETLAFQFFFPKRYVLECLFCFVFLI